MVNRPAHSQDIADQEQRVYTGNNMNPFLRRTAFIGSLLGLAAGVLALGAAFLAAWRCLPFHISQPPQPWPWACSEPASSVIQFLAFPVNLLTDDLSHAVRLAPVSLALYVLLGALLGWAAGATRSSKNL
jgi:uncharacterized membrane protein